MIEINRKYLNIAIAVIFFALIIMFFGLYQNSNECLDNPLKYAAEKGSQGDNNMMCNCFFTDPSYQSFYFDKEGIEFSVHRR